MRKFSKAAPGGVCPRCRGTSFRAKRSGLGLLTFGIFARKTRVECETCGRKFRRA